MKVYFINHKALNRCFFGFPIVSLIFMGSDMVKTFLLSSSDLSIRELSQ